MYRYESSERERECYIGFVDVGNGGEKKYRSSSVTCMGAVYSQTLSPLERS